MLSDYSPLAEAFLFEGPTHRYSANITLTTNRALNHWMSTPDLSGSIAGRRTLVCCFQLSMHVVTWLLLSKHPVARALLIAQERREYRSGYSGQITRGFVSLFPFIQGRPIVDDYQFITYLSPYSATMAWYHMSHSTRTRDSSPPGE